jgi:hypothetical protein
MVLSHIGYVEKLHVLLAYISLVPHWLCREVTCSLAYINRPIVYIILCDSIYNISFYKETNAFFMDRLCGCLSFLFFGKVGQNPG